MPQSLLKPDSRIYYEMMSHPAIFMHAKPQKIALVSDAEALLEEVLKHPNLLEVYCITQKSPAKKNQKSRVIYHSDTSLPQKSLLNTFDIIILDKAYEPKALQQYFSLLHEKGILVQPANSPFDVETLQSLQKNLRLLPMTDMHIVSFPEPTFPLGWRSLVLSLKQGAFSRIREKDIFNKPFATHYYNLDTHRAALAVPEFMRKKLGERT